MAIHDVNATELIMRTAKKLEQDMVVQPPEWAEFARTGTNRERPPAQENWWFVRSAAIMRKLFIYGPVGTSKLRVKFGGKKNKGYKPEHFAPAAGNHIRKILQQLEKSGLARQTEKGTYKGRVLTPKGQQLLSEIASEILKENNITFDKIPNTDLKVDEKPKKKAKKSTKKKKKKTKKAEPKKEAEKKETKAEPEKKPEVKAEKKEEPKAEEKALEKKE